MSLTGGTVSLDLSTRPSPTNATLTVAGQPVTITEPSGPFVRVSAVGASLNIGDTVLSGNFAFDQQIDPGPDGLIDPPNDADNVKTTRFAASNVSLTFSGNGITNGQGAFVVSSAGIAGMVSGQVSAAAAGFSVGGDIGLRINTTTSAVNQTITLNGVPISIVFGSGEVASSGSPFFQVFGGSLSLNIANFVSIEGSFSFTNLTSPPRKAFAGTGVTIFLGQGPAYLSGGVLNPSAVGLLLTNATIGLVDYTVNGKDVFALDATGTIQVLGVSGVTLSGTARVRVNNSGQVVSETLTIPNATGNAADVPVMFPTADLVTSFAATNLQLTVLGQTLLGDFTFSKQSTATGNVVIVTAANVSLSLGGGANPPVQVTNGSGVLQLSSAGLAGTLSANLSVNVPNVSVSGTFGLSINNTANPVTFTPPGATSATSIPAGPYVRVSATGATFTVMGQTLTGDFAVESVTDPSGLHVTRISAANVSLSLLGLVNVTNGQGKFVIANGALAGTLSGNVSIPAASFSGNFTVEFNTGESAVNQTFNADAEGAASTLSLPAGPFFRVDPTATLTVAGQTLSGSFSFETASGDSGPIVRVSASNVTFNLGDGSTNYLSLTNGSGQFVLGSGGIAGSLTGTIGVNIPGVTVNGTLTVQVNTLSTAIDQTFTGADGDPVVVNLPAGPFVRVAGTAISVNILGQTISGDFAFQRSKDASNKTIVLVSADNVALNLGNGLVTVTGGHADFVLSSSGIAGQFGGTLGVNLTGISFAGTLQVQVNDTGAAVNETFNDGATPVVLTLPSGQFVRVGLTTATLTVFGQTLTADALTFEKSTDADGSTVVKVAVAGLDIQLGPARASPIVNIQGASGQLVITANGLAGAATVTITASTFNLPGITLPTATATVEFNTATSAVNESFLIGGQTVTLALPSGPYVRVALTNVAATLGGVSITGDFSFDQATNADGSSTQRLAIANGSLTFSGNGITAATGAFVISSAGVAGVLTGQIGVAAGGFSVGGSVGLRINTTTAAVNQTITLNGQAIAVVFGASEVATDATHPFVQLFGSDLTLSIGDFVTIQGSVSFSNNQFAATGVSIFLGKGPAKLGNGDVNPLAQGVLLSNASIGLIQFPGTTTGYALEATGTVSIVGISGVTITGTAEIRVNTSGMPINQTLTIPNSSAPAVVLNFPTADRVTTFTATGATLSLLGQTLSGDFSFDPATDSSGNKTLRVAAANVALSLGNAPITVTNGQGSLIVTSGGLAGQFSATVTTSIPGVTFAGTFGLAINTTGQPVNQTFTVGTQTIPLNLPAGPYLRVSGTGVTLSVSGQTLTGDFAIERVVDPSGNNVVRVSAANVSLSLLGLVNVTNGKGAFVVANGALAGQLSGDVSVTAVSFSGSFTVEFNTGKTAVHQVFAADASGLQSTLDLPAGPFFRVDPNATLSFAGQSISADYAFEQVSGASGPIVRVSVQNATLNLGDGTTNFLSITNGTGSLILSSSGIAGLISGTVAVNIPGVSLGGNLAIQINTTGAAVNQSFTAADGSTTTVNLPAGPFLRIGGTGVSLTIAGQTLTGDFAFQRQLDSTGKPVLQIAANNVAIGFGGTASVPIVGLTNGQGYFLVSTAGIAGTIAATVALNVPSVTLSGTLRLSINNTTSAVADSFAVGSSTIALNLPAGPYFRVEGTGLSLTLAGQTITGDFAFDQAVSSTGAKVVRVAALNVAISLGGGLVSVQNGSGLLVATTAGIAGQLSGAVSVNVPNLAFAGTFTIQVNNTTSAVNQTFTVGASTATLTLPAGPFVQVAGTGVSLTIGQAGSTSPLATLSGNFAFQQYTNNGQNRVSVAASNVSLMLGDGTTNLLGVTNGQGVFVLSSAGAAGSFSASASLNVPNVTLGGTFGVTFNNTTSAINETFTVGGQSQSLVVPAGPYFRVSGTAVTVSVLGQTISGNLTIQQSTLAAGGKVLSLSLSNGEIDLGDGTTAFVRATNGQGTLVVKTVGGVATLYGQFSAGIVIDVPNVSLSGTFSVTFNNGTTAVRDTVNVGGSNVVLTIPAGPFLKIDGQNAALTILNQTLSGNFTIRSTTTNGASVVAVAATNVSLSIGTQPTPFIGITGASGALLIAGGGVAATIAVGGFNGGSFTTHLPGLSLTATSLTIDVNTLATAVNQTFSVGDGSTSVTLNEPAGPFVKVQVLGATLTLGGSGAGAGVALSGDFAFDQSTDPGPDGIIGTPDDRTITRIAAANVGLTFSGQTLAKGEGAFVLLPPDPTRSGSGGFAGFLSGQLAVSGGGVSASASLGLQVNKSGLPVNQTITVGSKTFTIAFPDGSDVFTLIGSGSIDIGGFVTIEGSFSFTSGQLTATNANVFLGQGPGLTSTNPNVINPAARGVLLSGATIGVVQVGSGSTATYAMHATGTVQVLGVPGVSLSGTATIDFNNTTGSVTIPGFSSPTISEPKGTASFSGSLDLNVLGQDLKGTYGFSQTTDASGQRVILISASGVTLSLGDGTPAPFTLTGAGDIAVSSAGLAGVIDASATLDPSTGIGGTLALTLSINTTAVAASIMHGGVAVALPAGPYVKVQGTGISLTIAGQTLTGDFTFQQINGPTNGQPNVTPPHIVIAAVNVGLDIRAGPNTTDPKVISLTQGQGFFLIQPSGIAGRLSGTVILDNNATKLLPGISLSGTFTLAVNTTNAAVNQQITVGGQTLTLDVQAGPYVRFEGTGVTLNLFGQHLSGDFAFEQATSTAPAGKVVRVVANNVSLGLGNGQSTYASLNGGSGTLVIDTTGLAGQVSGVVAVSIPGVSLGGTFLLQVNNTSHVINDTFDIGGSSLNLDLPAGPYLRFQGTGASLTVAGQTINADFSIEQLTISTGDREVRIAVANGSLSLAGGLVSIGIDPNTQLPSLSGAILVANGGVAAQLSGPLSLGSGLSGFSFGGSFALAINSTSLPVNQDITLGTTHIVLDLPAGPFVKVSGTGVTLSVLNQTLSGDFAFQQTNTGSGQSVVLVGVANASLSLGAPASPIVAVTAGQGSFLITSDGIAGSLSASVALNVPGVSFSGQFGVSLNQTAKAVNQTLTVGGQTLSLVLPVGPYLRVSGTGVSLTIAGQTLTGDFAFQRVTDSNNAVQTEVAAANVGLSLGSGSNPFVKVTNGQGGFLIIPNTPGHTDGGLAGSISATVALNIPGVALSGTFALAINNTASAVNQTITVGSGSVTINVPSGPYVRVTATGASLTILGQTLSGNFSFEQATANGVKTITLAASNVSLSLGDGTNTFVSVSQNSTQTALFVITSAGLAGQVSANVTINIPGVTSASASNIQVSINNTTAAVNQSVTLDGATLTLNLPAGPYLQVEADGLILTILGQNVSGNFVFTQTKATDGTNVVRIAATNVGVKLGGDPQNPLVSLANGQGALLVTTAGVAGQVSASVTTNIPNVTFTGSFSLSINTTNAAVDESFLVNGQTVLLTVPAGPFVRVDGTGVKLGVAGQTLTGDFAFEQTTDSASRTVVKVGVANLGLRLGDGTTDFVVVSGGNGALVISPAGFAGTLAATVALNIPGVTFSGTLSVTIAQTSAPLDETITVGGTPIEISVPAAGSFVKVSGTGVQPRPARTDAQRQFRVREGDRGQRQPRGRGREQREPEPGRRHDQLRRRDRRIRRLPVHRRGDGRPARRDGRRPGHPERELRRKLPDQDQHDERRRLRLDRRRRHARQLQPAGRAVPAGRGRQGRAGQRHDGHAHRARPVALGRVQRHAGDQQGRTQGHQRRGQQRRAGHHDRHADDPQRRERAGGLADHAPGDRRQLLRRVQLRDLPAAVHLERRDPDPPDQQPHRPRQ